MSASLRKPSKHTCTVDQAWDLIQRLTDPRDGYPIPKETEEEQRLRIILYFLRKSGCQASGVECMVDFGAVRTASTSVFAVAIRTGGVEEMFSLHKKTKLSIRADQSLAERIDKEVRLLAAMQHSIRHQHVFWREAYPEPMKQKSLLHEIKSHPGYKEQLMPKLSLIADAWTLHCRTPVVSHPTVRARL